MNYVVKDLPEINLIDELLRHDPDVREKLEMENDNTVVDIKKKIKHTGKNIIVCGTRMGKGVSINIIKTESQE